MDQKENNSKIIIANKNYCNILEKILYIDEGLSSATIEVLRLYKHVEYVCGLIDHEYSKLNQDADTIDHINYLKRHIGDDIRTCLYKVYGDLTNKVNELAEISAFTEFYEIKELTDTIFLFKQICLPVYIKLLDINYDSKQYIIDYTNTLSRKKIDSSLAGILISIKGIEDQLLLLIYNIILYL